MPPSLLVSPRARGCTVRRFPERLAVGGSSPRVRGVRSGRALLDPADWFTPVRGAPCGRLWTSESNLCFIPAGAGRRSPEARRGHSRSGPSPCPVALPEETASRIDLGRRDLSRRARGAPAPRVSGSGAGPRNAQGSPSARMILRAISPASLWPARDRHGNSPIVAMAISARHLPGDARSPSDGPPWATVGVDCSTRCPPRRRRSAPTHRKRSLPCSRARPAGPLARRRPARS